MEKKKSMKQRTTGPYATAFGTEKIWTEDIKLSTAFLFIKFINEALGFSCLNKVV